MLTSFSTIALKSPVDGSLIFPCIIGSGEDWVLVDTGYPDTSGDLLKQLNSYKLKATLLTHDDFDHVGGLSAIRKTFPTLPFWSSEPEAHALSGLVSSERLLQAEAGFDALPEDMKSGAAAFIELLRNQDRFEIKTTWQDGQECLPGWQVIYTPGHTRGHISLFAPDSLTLIAGDALVFADGRLEIANPHYALDLAAAVRSVARIQALRPTSILCYHGGWVKEGIDDMLEELQRIYASM